MTPFLWFLLVASVVILGWILVMSFIHPPHVRGLSNNYYYDKIKDRPIHWLYWLIFICFFIKEFGTSNHPITFEELYTFCLGVAFYFILFVFTDKKQPK